MVGPRNNDGPLQPFQHEDKERAMARRLGVRRFVDGWLQPMAPACNAALPAATKSEMVLRYGMGTTEYMRSTGGYALTLECGQHAEPVAPDVAYRAIMNTLAFLGFIDAPPPAPIADADMEALNMVVVHDKLDANELHQDLVQLRHRQAR